MRRARGGERVLQGLWALFACGGIDEAMLMEASADAARQGRYIIITCTVRLETGWMQVDTARIGMDITMYVLQLLCRYCGTTNSL